MTGLELSFMVKDKSFIKSRKSNGPSIEPCGTPILIFPQHEEVPLIRNLDICL
jgi:hypothetical protein